MISVPRGHIIDASIVWPIYFGRISIHYYCLCAKITEPNIHNNASHNRRERSFWFAVELTFLLCQIPKCVSHLFDRFLFCNNTRLVRLVILHAFASALRWIRRWLSVHLRPRSPPVVWKIAMACAIYMQSQGHIVNVEVRVSRFIEQLPSWTLKTIKLEWTSQFIHWCILQFE